MPRVPCTEQGSKWIYQAPLFVGSTSEQPAPAQMETGPRCQLPHSSSTNATPLGFHLGQLQLARPSLKIGDANMFWQINNKCSWFFFHSLPNPTSPKVKCFGRSCLVAPSRFPSPTLKKWHEPNWSTQHNNNANNTMLEPTWFCAIKMCKVWIENPRW